MRTIPDVRVQPPALAQEHEQGVSVTNLAQKHGRIRGVGHLRTKGLGLGYARVSK